MADLAPVRTSFAAGNGASAPGRRRKGPERGPGRSDFGHLGIFQDPCRMIEDVSSGQSDRTDINLYMPRSV